MAFAALLGVLVLAVLCWRLRARVVELESQVREARSLRRRLDDVREGLERGLAVTRTHLAEVAAGEPPAREVIVRGAPFREIEPAPALVLLQQHPETFVLDVRTPAEFASGHIPGARLIPHDEIEDRLKELPPPDTQMLVTCAAGGRSTAACNVLADHGYTRILNLAGGMHAWTGPRERDNGAAAELPPPPPGDTRTRVTNRGGSIGEGQIVDAIRQCFDPEIPVNVYDLGLIYDIDIAAEAINIRMTLTSEGCPSARQIPEDVRRTVAALGQDNVNVDVVFDPPWHPARISAEAREKLGLS